MVTMKSMSKNSYRTHRCGDLTEKEVGKEVRLCGWVDSRRDHGGVIFVDLRDRYGITQIVFDPKLSKAFEKANELRQEFVIGCVGQVRQRPKGMINTKLGTGQIEVACNELEIFSKAPPLPFNLNEEQEVSENLRLKYRYLDLRRPQLQKNLMVRHQMLQIVRNHLDEHGFLEIETPILYKSTPEGARDFIVPSRILPGNFYALPQSPQTLKQLLMMGGFDRYYQIARCFRDEDLRADRQPEFSQIDIEASFINEETLFPILEEMIQKIWEKVLKVKIKAPFLQMPYAEAMSRFGSDKPDTRFGMELQDISKVFAQSEFRVFQAAQTATGSIRALVVPAEAEAFSRKDLDDLQEQAQRYGAKGLLWIKVSEPLAQWQSPAAKFLKDEEKKNLASQLKLKKNDLVLVVADPKNKIVCTALGALRLQLARRLKLIPEENSEAMLESVKKNPQFLWVTHFPLLEYDEQERRYFALHHPFTSPRLEDIPKLLSGKDLEGLEACAYDLVLNGVEIGGGSLRIYRTDVQDAMFRALGLTPEQAKQKFGFFLEALGFGAPPHGGIAFGVDRLTALLCGVGPIRDVMAFPKTQKGACLMSETPSPVQPEQLVELGISLVKR